MMKTLKNQSQRDKSREKMPKTAQQVLPIQKAWADGIFLVGRTKYAQTWRFTDINYAVASREDKESLFLRYSDILNACDVGAVTKLTIVLRRMNAVDVENGILIPYQNDALDEYRREYNDFLLAKATQANPGSPTSPQTCWGGIMVRELYVTVTCDKRSVDEARAYFTRIGTELTANFARLDAKLVPVNGSEKLRILHDFFRPGEDFDAAGAFEGDVRDCIAPESLAFRSDHFRMGERFGRALFLKDYAAYIKDRFLADLTDRGRNLVLSLDIVPVPTDEAVKEVEKRRLGIETNIGATRS